MDAEANPCLETLFQSTMQSGQRRGKFKPKPKPKAQIDMEKPGSVTSCPQGNESVTCSHNAQYIPSESEYINEASIPAMPTNDLLNFSSFGYDDTSSQIPEIEEPLYPGETSENIVSPIAKSRKGNPPKVPDGSSDHQQASISGLEDEADDDENYVHESPRGSPVNEDECFDGNLQEPKATKKRKVLRKSNKSAPQKEKPVPKHKSLENEADDDENYVHESPRGSPVNEDECFDGNLQEPKATKKRKVLRKSNKSAPQKEKPVPKHKKAEEVLDPASKGRPGKFSHTTRRKRRQVDKALLDTPEDEIDVTKLCMRDLILLAEHRERISSKEGKALGVPSTMHSAGTSYAGYEGVETFASEQGGLSDDQTIPIIQESSTYINYQTYMNRTPRSRWSKQDTELFYEALQQFGSDISMIQQLFPGRSRAQVKLKYKKEERQNPLRLHEALTTRSKDNSHFQLVIEHLKEIAAQEKDNSCRDDSTGFPGDEEDVDPGINEEVAKPELAEEGEVEAKEPDVAEPQSPAKSCDTEDDWSQYKSEL